MRGRFSIPILLLLVLSLLGAEHVVAQVCLPKLISDGMVLQRDVNLKIWGWASPQERVTVRFVGKRYRVVTDMHGKWEVRLPALKAGGPYEMEIRGRNRILLRDILIGDVWFCSGQSNMYHMLNIHDIEYAKEIAEANHPQIRQFLVPNTSNLVAPQADFIGGNWEPAVGDKVRDFSVVAYFFAKHIQETQHIPVGIISAAVGGTPIEAWTSAEGLASFTDLATTIIRNRDTAYVRETNRLAAIADAPRPSADKGLADDKKWFEVDYLAQDWRSINVPGYWEDQGIHGLDGVVWYRKEVEIPAAMIGKPTRIFLGRIVDADHVYINGQEVGHTGYQYPQRRYHVPVGLLRPGKNTFVVRVTNHGGKGGFVPDKPYFITAGTDTVDLKGTWHYSVGEVFGSRDRGDAPQPIHIQSQPTVLYNGMVSPATNYAIKGVLWYQGESNTGKPRDYEQYQKAMIHDWRNRFGQSDLPFLYVQLPGFMEYRYQPSESHWAQLRESQRRTLSIPNTAMAIAIDLGEWNDIHPGRKKEVGDRLALLARHSVYGENMVASGPLFRSAQVSAQGVVRLNFDHVGAGLRINKGQELAEFAVAGADKKFIWAKARIEGKEVVVWHESVPTPHYVRYAWADNPVNPNLYNVEGLPASPFEVDLH